MIRTFFLAAVVVCLLSLSATAEPKPVMGKLVLDGDLCKVDLKQGIGMVCIEAKLKQEDKRASYTPFKVTSETVIVKEPADKDAVPGKASTADLRTALWVILYGDDGVATKIVIKRKQ